MREHAQYSVQYVCSSMVIGQMVSKGIKWVFSITWLLLWKAFPHSKQP